MSLHNLKQYQKIVNKIINKFFIEEISNSFLQKMCRHALSGGKRLRSSFALDIYITMLQHLGMFPVVNDLEKDLKLDTIPLDICYFMISVELFHTTSIILDDLPSMDNDKYRREKETIHYKYGQSNANILSGFCLEQGLYYFNKSLSIWKKELDNASSIIEISKHLNYFKQILLKEMMIATEGQYLDLFPETAPLSDTKYWECYGNSNDINLNMVTMKTAPFYVIAFCGGYLLARLRYSINQSQHKYMTSDELNVTMERTKIRFDKLRESSYQFSYAFQISDDILDMEKDSLKNNLENHCIVNNYPLIVGKKKAIKQVTKSLNIWKKYLTKLFLISPLVNEIYDYIPNRKK